MVTRLLPFATAALLACGSAAHAGPLLSESMYDAIVAGGNTANVGGVEFASTGGNFIKKSVNNGGGLGITGGPTGDEIDVGEAFTMRFAAQRISDFSLALLYNGPEFGDYREIAQVSAYNGDTLIAAYTLTVGLDGAGAVWSGSGSLSNLSPPTDQGAAAWLVSGNPFGDASITSLQFTALTSSLCQPGISCNNQSDYVVSSVNAVPEPGTCALAAMGLGVMGFMGRRRRG
jgi:PEP-CTERM motif